MHMGQRGGTFSERKRERAAGAESVCLLHTWERVARTARVRGAVSPDLAIERHNHRLPSTRRHARCTWDKGAALLLITLRSCGCGVPIVARGRVCGARADVHTAVEVVAGGAGSAGFGGVDAEAVNKVGAAPARGGVGGERLAARRVL